MSAATVPFVEKTQVRGTLTCPTCVPRTVPPHTLKNNDLSCVCPVQCPEPGTGVPLSHTLLEGWDRWDAQGEGHDPHP